mmetsp:Transcript_31835/g.46947  ORF Transcript_31835/g.46947 Transcript_31835/m.46947 type:complete len:130 (-) Transcript_31835:186-575(-)|eukprot:CAMPEP_0194211776 /NCGR_PEP_ID=MMETSP0156-20130528/11142_1 /TAXON_ID=33649 /ORGANISM="Thalassionema nitzschioides, Strain L26-B" /LENGTH=129 /DNA_ID=CAMNT_0038939433 /DNA_START=134 /DNA_END=523 /DNA_ORIENTATION=+
MWNGRFFQQNVPVFAASSLIGFSLLGCALLSAHHEMHKKELERLSEKNSKSDMTHDQAMIAAMIENARDSSWQENLSNAMQAQERFMLPGRKTRTPEFVHKIKQRSDDIMEKQRLRAEEEKNKTNHFWK